MLDKFKKLRALLSTLEQSADMRLEKGQDTLMLMGPFGFLPFSKKLQAFFEDLEELLESQVALDLMCEAQVEPTPDSGLVERLIECVYEGEGGRSALAEELSKLLYLAGYGKELKYRRAAQTRLEAEVEELQRQVREARSVAGDGGVTLLLGCVDLKWAPHSRRLLIEEVLAGVGPTPEALIAKVQSLPDGSILLVRDRVAYRDVVTLLIPVVTRVIEA